MRAPAVCTWVWGAGPGSGGWSGARKCCCSHWNSLDAPFSRWSLSCNDPQRIQRCEQMPAFMLLHCVGRELCVQSVGIPMHHCCCPHWNSLNVPAPVGDARLHSRPQQRCQAKKKSLNLKTSLPDVLHLTSEISIQYEKEHIAGKEINKAVDNIL